MGVRWTILVGVFALVLASCGSTFEADEVCPVFAEVRAERALDSDDTTRFEALVDELRAVMPLGYHDEMALFYYPYGGSVEGLNTDGVNAARAGETLDQLFRTNCGVG